VAQSDIFLGWTHITGPDGIDRDFYVRQLRDWKFSVPIELMLPPGMTLPWAARMPACAALIVSSILGLTIARHFRKLDEFTRTSDTDIARVARPWVTTGVEPGSG
jgi:hypothetical protein